MAAISRTLLRGEVKDVLLQRIVSGELQHKKTLQLSDQEIADIAAYMSTGGK